MKYLIVILLTAISCQAEISLLPDATNFLARTEISLGAGYNSGMKTYLTDIAVRTSLGKNLSIGAVAVKDAYGIGVAPLTLNITGEFHGINLIAGSGIGYDKSDFGFAQISKPMSYMFVGAAYPIHIGHCVVSPSVELANRNTRQGADILANLSISF